MNEEIREQYPVQEISMDTIMPETSRANPFPQNHKLNLEKEWTKQYSFQLHCANEEALEVCNSLSPEGVGSSILVGLNNTEEWVKENLGDASKKQILRSVHYYYTSEESLMLLDSVETIRGLIVDRDTKTETKGRVYSGKSYLTLMRRKGGEYSFNFSTTLVVIDDKTKRVSRTIDFPNGITSDKEHYSEEFFPKDPKDSQLLGGLIEDLKKLRYDILILEMEKVPS